MYRGSTSLPRVWNDKWQPIRLNLRFLSQVGVKFFFTETLKVCRVIYKQSNPLKTRTSIARFYICLLSNYICQYFQLNNAGKKPFLTWVRTKHGPGVHGPPLWTGSMDHFHGPGPWTPCHGPGPWTVFFIFIRRFCTRSMDNQKQKYSQNRFDRTLSTNAHDWSQIFSCAYMTYTLLAHVQSQDC